jgi:RNA methyltransferase, TrmH family
MNTPERITSRSNPLIKFARSLRERKERSRSGKFLVEGIAHIGEASAAGWQIDSVLFAPELLESYFAMNMVTDFAARGIRTVSIPPDVLDSLAEKENPQGLIAIVDQKNALLDSLSPAEFRYAMALVSPQDPGNIGTILRTLDAVDADGLFLLDGGADQYHPSAVRASMGALFWKPVIKTTFDEFASWAKENHFQMVGTTVRATLDFREIKLNNQRLIIVMGSEQKGLSREQLEICDVSVKLPMHGKTSSLNLAVAAGVLLYNLIEGRHASQKV